MISSIQDRPDRRSPLGVHIVLQDVDGEGFSETRALAAEIYARLVRGARPTGIPVHVWVATLSKGGLELPPHPTLDDAERNAIILLIDWNFFNARRHWQIYLDKLTKHLRSGVDLLLPVSICGDAQRTAPSLNDINCVPVRNPDVLSTDEHVFQAILTALMRLLGSAEGEGPAQKLPWTAPSAGLLPDVFLCHSKTDGAPLAKQLRRYIYEDTQLACFFDMHAIPHGSAVRDFISASIARSCLLVVWTDRLLESRWCQFEILEARKQQRPLLVLDALSVNCARIFPFLGNMPVVRWNDNPDQVVSALLLELVRTGHLHCLFESLRGPNVESTTFMLHPPDIMETSSILRSANATAVRVEQMPRSIVYPDPPLPAEEMAFLRETFPALHLHSVSEWTALRAAGVFPGVGGLPTGDRPSPLTGRSIGLSVSESETWKQRGLVPEHQDDFAEVLAREIILLGGRVLWGGDLRPEGLGTRLERLVRAYHQADHAPQDHVACFLAWPNYRDVPLPDLQARRALADILCMPRPGSDKTLSRSDAFDAVCFSMMRREMARQSHARIVLGGRLNQYRGRYPGIVEEALEAVDCGVPLYVVGGFGGAAEAVYEAIVCPTDATLLASAWRDRCKQADRLAANTAYDALAEGLQLDFRVDHDGMLTSFATLGAEGHSRRNGLSLDENLRLARSRDMHEIIALLVKGIASLPCGLPP